MQVPVGFLQLQQDGSNSFSLGTCVHQSLAEWAFKPTLSLPLIYQKNALSLRQSIIDDYTTRIGTEPSQSELAKTDHSLEDGLYMMANYSSYYGSPLADGWSPVEVEQTFTVPIPGTPHFLECTQDAIIRSPTEQLAIMEHKTYSRRPNEDMLYRNFQFKCYNWALSTTLPNVLGVAYNGLWVKREPPRGATTADLFHREIITFPPSVMQIFEQHLATIVTEMSDPSLVLYEHIPWDGCRCSYKEACNARLNGLTIDLDLHYKKRDKTPAWVEDD